MRRAAGRGGELYLAGDPTRTGVSLRDCGDGFDWRAAQQQSSFWVEAQPFSFSFYEHGVWRKLAPLEVHYPTGRVAFGRSLRSLGVRGEGWLLPLTCVGGAERWELSFRLPMLSEPVLGGPTPQPEARPLDAGAVLYGSEIDPFFDDALLTSDLLVRLPFALGVFWGFARVADKKGTAQVVFNEGGVQYGPV